MRRELEVVAVHAIGPLANVVDATFDERRNDEDAPDIRRRQVIDSPDYPYGRALDKWRRAGGMMPPPPGPGAGEAKAAIVAAIDAKTAAILAPYPVSERMNFDAKAAESKTVLAADVEAFDLGIAPLLAAECAAEHGEADTDTRRRQIIAKAALVGAKAAVWGELAATLSGIRQRAFAAIDGEEADVAANLAKALGEIAALEG